MIKKILILSIPLLPSFLFSWYGFLPDDMKLSDALCIQAHHAEALDTRGWNIPVQYGTFYDLMAKHGARSLDIRLHLGTNEEAVFEAAAKDVANFFTNLFSGKDITQTRSKDIALIGCHEHDKYEYNCYFTRLIEKREKPDVFQVFLNDIKRFLDNNPSESLLISIGGFIGSSFTSDVNGWKGKSNQDIAYFFDNLIKETGLLPRVFNQSITDQTTVGDMRGKVVFITGATGVVEYSRVLKPELPITWNKFNLTQKQCELQDDSYSIFVGVAMHPENPFDTSIDQGIIKKITDLIPDFLAGSKTEKLIWNYATEVNTPENILKAANCCHQDKKVNFIAFNFLSKHESRMPLDVIYEINRARMHKINIYEKMALYEFLQFIK